MHDQQQVIFINDYPMDVAYDLYRKGEYPEHHLWGLTELERLGWRVNFYPGPQKSRFDALFRRFGLSANIRYQLKFYFTHFYKNENIYFGSFGIFAIIGILRAFGLFRPKCVALIHHPVGVSRVRSLSLRGADALFFLNRHSMQATIANHPHIAKKSNVIDWFVDLKFFNPERSEAFDQSALKIVAAGKEVRDYDCLVEAISKLPADQVHCKIYCSSETAPSKSHPSVEVAVGGLHGSSISYRDLAREYTRSDLIVIPMKAMTRTAGVTSLFDALAVGRAFIMTNNPGIEFDPAVEGIGDIVEAGDSDALAQKIRAHLDDRARNLGMGKNSRAYAEANLNIERYGKRLASALADVFYR